MKKILIVVCLIFATIVTARAQYREGEKMYAFGWEIGMPQGATRDFISETSFSGGYFEYRDFLKSNLSVGFAISFSSYSQYVTGKTYENSDKTQALHTDMQRIIYTIPIMLTGQYYFTQGQLSPYIGLGMGAQYSDQDVLFSYFDLVDRNWGFVARPTLGTLVNLNKEVGINLSASYNIATNNMKYFNLTSLQYLCFQIGLVFNAQ